VGGVDAFGIPVSIVERYHPDTQQFEVVGDITALARANHTATLLTDGRLLIVGGIDATGTVREDALLFDPVAGDTQSIPDHIVAPRAGSFAALLPSGQVLVSAEMVVAGRSTAPGVLYNPGTSSFTSLRSAPGSLLPTAGYSDTTPGVAAISPVDGASNIGVGIRFAVRFSKNLKPASLNGQTVTLIGPNGAVPIKVSAAEAGLLLFVTPQQQLLPNSDYGLFIRGAADAQGRELPTSASSFHTAALAKPRAPVFSVVTTEVDTELWTPSAKNLKGSWKSGNASAALRHLPKRAAVAQKLYGKKVKDGLPSAPDGVTALAGQVLRLNGQPLAHVTLSVGAASVATDDNGEFLLSNLSSGNQILVIDGSSANDERHRYGRYEYRAQIENAKTNVLPFVIWMTRLDVEQQATIASPTTREVVLTNPHIPGLELHVPTGTVIRDAKGNIVTQVSLTAIPVDQPPFPLPSLQVPVYFTVQPGGAQLQQTIAGAVNGARLIYPNFSRSKPGTRIDFWNYDSHERGWYVYGQGTVTRDGKQVMPDPGVVIHEFSGAMVALPSTSQAQGPNAACQAADAAKAGDPVDCSTGLFLLDRTDLAVSDLIPLEVHRVYRPMDNTSRAFGIGASLGYDIFLVGDTRPWTYSDLVFPDGSKVHFVNTGSRVTFSDALYTTSSTPGPYFGAKLRFTGTNSCYWELDRLDGTVMCFPEAIGSSIARQGALTSMQDRYGNSLTLTRDSNYNLTTAVSPSGRTLSFNYDASNRVTQVSDNLGRTVFYYYDAQGRLTSVKDAASHTESYTYDSSNNLLTVTDKRGNIQVTNTYDTNNRVSRQDYPDGTHVSFAYTVDANNHVTRSEYTDERGIIKRVDFNSSQYPTTITRALGLPEQQITSFVLDPVTNAVQSRTDPLGRVTRYQYDSFGRPTLVTNLYGTSSAVSWSFTYEPVFHQLSTVVDPLGHGATFKYDNRGTLVSKTDAMGDTTSITPNAQGLPASISDALGHSTQYGYVQADLASVTNALSQTTNVSTDTVGRVISVSDPMGNARSIFYDPMDRILQTVDPSGGLTTQTYDPNGNLLTVQDPRQVGTHQFGYDTRDRVHTYTDPLGAVETYNYDAIGNLASKVDRNHQLTSYAYDSLNRLKTITYPDSSTLTITWDAGNRATDFVDSLNGTIHRDYDGLDRMTVERGPQGELDYFYDGANRRDHVTVVGQSNPITYQFDNANRLTRVAQGSFAVAFGYDAANRRTSVTLPNGIVGTFGFDNDNQLTSISYDGAAHVADASYAYDPAGRRTSATGSLVRPTVDAVLASATFDAGNHLSSIGSTNLSYDGNGNQISSPTGSAAGYTWNSRNQLIATSAGSTFRYDAIGRMVSRTTGGVTSSYTYDGLSQLVASGMTTLRGLGLDEVYGQISSGVTLGYLHDASGSVVALTDGGQSTPTTYNYAAYGAATSTGQSGPATSNSAFGYTGAETDRTDQLIYLRNRFYSSQLARFASEDPIGLSGGINTYAYVEGNPVSLVDPSGEFGVFGAIGGAAFNVGFQMLVQGKSWKCVDLKDVAISGLVGFIAPGWLGIGRYGVGLGGPIAAYAADVGATTAGLLVEQSFPTATGIAIKQGLKRIARPITIGSECECN
jgi:RHS repeat-associated protein